MSRLSPIYTIFAVCTLSLLPVTGEADNAREATNSNLSAFERYKQAQQQGFDRYKEEHKKFLSLLQQDWQDYKKKQALVRDNTPKLPTAPIRRGSQIKPIKQTVEPVTLIDPVTPVAPTTADKPIQKPDIATDKRVTNKRGINKTVINKTTTDKTVTNKKEQSAKQITELMFYGQAISLPSLPRVRLQGTSEAALHSYWKSNSEANFEPVLSALNEVKKRLALSDWAVYLLVQDYLNSSITEQNQVIAASWFLLNNLGYEVRIASGDQSLMLLMTSQQTLFGMPYYPIKDKRYYQLLGEASKTIRSYAGEFSEKNQPLDMRFTKTLRTVPEIQYRDVVTTSNGEKITIRLPYDLQRIKYFATYPQLDLRYYFEAPVDPITARGLREQISPLLTLETRTAVETKVTGRTRDRQVSKLLHFIHESFPYAIDDKQFGYENYLTVEESLHYQSSDCEDRSVLFAWLAKNLLREPVVALFYEGHVATALTRRGQLVSADPTYIGANLGDIMPNFVGMRPKVIRF